MFWLDDLGFIKNELLARKNTNPLQMGMVSNVSLSGHLKDWIGKTRVIMLMEFFLYSFISYF